MLAATAARKAKPGPVARKAPAPRGLSLVELMIGLVVSLMIGIVATGTAMNFLGAQRQGVGASGGALGAQAALGALKGDIGAAGLGFYGDAQYRCQRLNLGAGSTTLWDNAAFVPLRITRVDGNDVVDVLQGSRVEAGAGALLAASTAGADAHLRSFVPAAVGDAVLLSPATAGTPCLVRSVTAVTAATDLTPLRLQFGGTGTHNAATFTVNPTYSGEGGSLTLLGRLRWLRIRVSSGQLLVEQPLTGESAVLARQVVGLRAQYGLSAAANTTTLDSWQDATGGFASLAVADLPRLRALRLGLVLRSTQRDKRRPGETACSASSAKPRLFNGTVEVEPDVSDWTCWRFRSAETVVPLRNLMLGAGT